MFQPQTSFAVITALLGLQLSVGAASAADPANRAEPIARGTAYLRAQQKSDGSWNDIPGFPGGVSALCTLALLESGTPAQDAKLVAAVDHLRTLSEPNRVYTTALQTLALARAEPQRDRALLERNVRWLEANQHKSGAISGAWGYGVARGVVDNSNTRFALLGLQAAEQAGADVNAATWRRAFDYWTSTQNDDGSWGYTPGLFGTGSMTCSGIASLVVASHKVDGDERSQRKTKAISRGLEWLGRNYTTKNNPNAAGVELPWLLYYLETLEDAGRLAKAAKIGDHDWFAEGSARLFSYQDRQSGAWPGHGNQGDNNSLISTSLALLFLTGKSQPQPPPPPVEK